MTWIGALQRLDDRRHARAKRAFDHDDIAGTDCGQHLRLERGRIARELHDTLLQGFQGLVLHFQAVVDQIPDGEPARQTMEKPVPIMPPVFSPIELEARVARYGEPDRYREHGATDDR